MSKYDDDKFEYLLEDAENLEVNEEGEIVPRFSNRKGGIKLKSHVFY